MKFLIIGNQNAITYKEIFPLIKNGKIWLGASANKGNRKFNVPDEYSLNATVCGIDPDGRKYVRGSNTRWYTNLDHDSCPESLPLYKHYSPEAYPKYDNYDAIEVSRVAEIPDDYAGVMGVPITFLDKYNPEQFEILGMTTGRKEFDPRAYPTIRYTNAIQHNPDGTTANGSKINTRAALRNDEPKGVYYTAAERDYKLEIVYARILIRNKHPKPPAYTLQDPFPKDT